MTPNTDLLQRVTLHLVKKTIGEPSLWHVYPASYASKCGVVLFMILFFNLACLSSKLARVVWYCVQSSQELVVGLVSRSEEKRDLNTWFQGERSRFIN